MKQYWLFICPTYYPQGGMRDFYNSYDTIEEGKAALAMVSNAAKENREIEEEDFIYQNDLLDASAHIYDSLSEKIIQYCERGKWSETIEYFHSWFPKTERF